MPQNDNVSKVADAIRQGITLANHLRNVQLSRDAADRMVTYYGGGDMSGEGDRFNMAKTYTEDAARLPVRDAEDQARMVAKRMMAKPDSFKRGGTVKKTGLAMVHKGERISKKSNRKSSRKSSRR